MSYRPARRPWTIWSLNIGGLGCLAVSVGMAFQGVPGWGAVAGLGALLLFILAGVECPGGGA